MLDEGDLELGCFSWNVFWPGSPKSPAEALIFEEALWGALCGDFPLQNQCGPDS